MSLFNTLDRSTQSQLKRIDSLGRAIRTAVQKNDDNKLSRLEKDLQELCRQFDLDLDDVLSIYL